VAKNIGIDLAADRAAALALVPVSAETERRLAIYAELLLKWQKTINLVAASTLPHIWTRHFADSLQVHAAAPEARLWVDLGTGGGFPGLVTAIVLADIEGARVHLIESDQRKCAFLREVSRETGAASEVHVGRIEDIAPTIQGQIHAVSARALDPLPQLLTLAEPFLKKGALGVFLKGQHLDGELTDSPLVSRYEIEMRKSKTSASAHLLLVKDKFAEPYRPLAEI
jgi:16S rRNA (guanine527-N7)-methyltransferase